MGVARALRGATRDRAVPQSRCRPVRSPETHPVRRQGRVGHLRRVVRNLDRRADRRDRAPRALPRRRDGRALGAVLPRGRGARRLPGRIVPHGLVALDPGRLRGEASSGDRNGLERRPADPGDRRRRGRPDRLPTQRQLVHTTQQRADHARRTSPTPRRLRSDTRDARHVSQWLPPPHPRSRHVRRLGRGALRLLRKDVAEQGFFQAHQSLHRPAGRSRRERAVVRVHRREDPEHRHRSRDRAEADPPRPPLRGEAASVRDLLLRGVQPTERLARRRQGDTDPAHDRERDRDERRCE